MGKEIFNEQLLPAKDKLYRFALSILHNAEEAADVVQEVMAKLWEDRKRLVNLQQPEAWAMRLVRNDAINRLRAVNNRKTDSLEGVQTQHQATTWGPYEKTASDNMMNHIKEAIQSLPELQQQMVQLRDVEGYQYEEICAVLELELNYVKVNLFRARQTLRKKLVALKMQQ